MEDGRLKPIVEPEEPTVEPEEPIVEPEKPIVEPEEPIVEPDDPPTMCHPFSAKCQGSFFHGDNMDLNHTYPTSTSDLLAPPGSATVNCARHPSSQLTTLPQQAALGQKDQGGDCSASFNFSH